VNDLDRGGAATVTGNQPRPRAVLPALGITGIRVGRIPDRRGPSVAYGRCAGRYANDVANVVIDLSEAHIWDASTVALLDAITTKYQARTRP
jgi:hypothetical protein